jgi:DNA-binding transcriptional ArsR family regulator
MDRAQLQGFLAREMSLEEIGRRVDRHPSTVSYWLRKHGLRAAHRDKHLAKGVVVHEELRRLVGEGLTQRELAERMGVSQSTIRHWLTRLDLTTLAGERHYGPDGRRLPGVTRRCPKHGVTVYVLSGRERYRCKRCRQEAVVKRRQTVKELLIADAGGKCVVCGYHRHPAALHFHHVDPSTKEFGLSTRGVARSLEKARLEARKCVLLCATCHAEVEAGVTPLPPAALTPRAGFEPAWPD